MAPRSPTLTEPVEKLSIFVVLFLVLAVLPARFHIGSLQLTGLRLYLLFLFMPCLLLVLSRPAPLLTRLVDLLFLAQIGWKVTSTQVMAPEAGLERSGSVSVDFLGGYLIARCFITSARQFHKTIFLIGLICAATLPLALIEATTGWAPLIDIMGHLPGLASLPLIEMPQRLGLDRAQVVFAHPIHYGIFASTAFTLSLLSNPKRIGPVRRLIFAATAGLGAFLSLSSGAVLAVAVQAMLLLWALISVGIAARWWYLLIGLVAVYVTVDLLSTRSAFRVFLSYATFSPHNAYWRAMILEHGVANALQNPLFGVGNTGWDRPGFMSSGSMDNFWLYLAVKYGFPSLIFTALAFISGILAVALDRKQPGSPDRLAWVVTMIACAFSLATVHVWTSIYSHIFFLFGAGLWMITPRRVPFRSVRPLRPAARLPYARPPSTLSTSPGRLNPVLSL